MPQIRKSATPPNPPIKSTEIRRVALSSYLGNTIEYYDFILYGSAAALVFGPLFFSNLSPTLGTIASFAVFSAGYIARPLGGIIFGSLGDRIGRKSVLLYTMTIMGVASGLIGLLPTYEKIGVIAPILLVALRVIQGFAVGGEWGGASLMAAEHAPPNQRGFYTAIGQAGLASGGLLSTLAMALVSQLPDGQLFSWGWRVPFLASFALLAVGVFTRVTISESPLFEELQEKSGGHIQRRGSFRAHRIELLRGMAASVPPAISSTVFGSFAVSYAVSSGHSRSVVLTALCVAWGLSIVATPLYGKLSDKLGRRPVYITAALSFAIFVYPLFKAIGSESTVMMFAAFSIAFALITVAMTGMLSALLSELFSTEYRYTGVSISYQGATVIGGLAPLGASIMLASGSNVAAVAILVAVFSLLGAAAVGTATESRGGSLRGQMTPSIEPSPTKSVQP
ncbi:MHS family MFS transporter (plasmid) [Rhodococcus sp. USK10]|uniref:MFS transporter n=1 Tax=Rhodococcus sp. USK10 TaxID=2789739 RepID=UPI001C5EC714|nr:MFS transporter [Rhodococcus sp. USK10]QYB00236.1 MHS family MFS transporter [Rhodococcus sp. USK10]